MIRALAAQDNIARARTLEDDLRVATCIHEGGHVLMARIHGLIRLPVDLPAIHLRQGEAMRLAAPAVFKIASDVDEVITREVLFGGFCAELCIYDREFLAAKKEIFVHADRSANDMLQLLKVFGAKIAGSSYYENLLRNGGEDASIAVHSLFDQYGHPTYNKLRNERPELIRIAQEIFDCWDRHQFQECTYLNISLKLTDE